MNGWNMLLNTYWKFNLSLHRFWTMMNMHCSVEYWLSTECLWLNCIYASLSRRVGVRRVGIPVQDALYRCLHLASPPKILLCLETRWAPLLFQFFYKYRFSITIANLVLMWPVANNLIHDYAAMTFSTNFVNLREKLNILWILWFSKWIRDFR